MPSELSLFFTDEQGQEQQLVVQANSFSIGRGESNDLVLQDSGLSRRHLLITKFEDDVQVADCGSQNGTQVNGKRISGNARLKDGDIISIGAERKIRVRLTTTAPVLNPQPVFAPPPPNPPRPPVIPPLPHQNSDAQPVKKPFDFSPALIAASAAGVIFIMAGILMTYLYFRPDGNDGQPTSSPSVPPPPPSSSPSPRQSLSPPPASPVPEIDKFEEIARQAVINISNEQRYNFPQGITAELKRRADQLAKPGLANVFQAINTQGKSVAAVARSQSVNPAFLFYLGLAETNGGQTGDPLAAARGALPEIKRLCATMGVSSGDHALLVVAAYKIPWGSGHAHSLVPVLENLMREPGADPQRDRSVWFLRARGKLNDTAYDFVLRFLAYGAIAQNPRQFGLDAPALVF